MSMISATVSLFTVTLITSFCADYREWIQRFPPQSEVADGLLLLLSGCVYRRDRDEISHPEAVHRCHPTAAGQQRC